MKSRGEEPRLIYTQLYEAFFTYIKVSVYAAVFISFPIISSQVWLFIAPGLYRSEKRALAALHHCDARVVPGRRRACLLLHLPNAFRFFLSFQTPITHPAAGGMQIELMARVSDYLGLVMKLVFAFGVAFELPVALTLMGKVGLLRSEDPQALPPLRLCRLFRYRRGADPARRADPDRPRCAADPALRDLDLLRPAGGT